MKIVMLCDFYNEALEYQENLLVKYYTKHGHDVTVITSTFESVFDYYEDRHDNRTPPRTYLDGSAKIIKLRYRYNILNRLRAYTRIDKILDAEAPDLIYVHDIMLNLPEAINYVRAHPHCQMIMDYHADYSNSGKNWLSLRVLHGVIRKRFLDRARPYLRKIFPSVPAGVKFLHEIYKVPYSEMEVLPLGADLDLGKEIRLNEEGKALRSSLGIPETAVVIFTGGKLAPAKKTELLLESVKRLCKPEIHVVIAGEASNEHNEYKRKLLSFASDKRIHFLGWLDRRAIYRCLDMADLAVFPASQSILWKQAIGMGLPLIVGNTGNQDISYLNAHNNIIILQNEDITVDGIADALGSVLNDTERMQQMRNGAELVADQSLNWDKLILRTLRYNLPQTNSGAETPAREMR